MFKIKDVTRTLLSIESNERSEFTIKVNGRAAETIKHTIYFPAKQDKCFTLHFFSDTLSDGDQIEVTSTASASHGETKNFRFFGKPGDLEMSALAITSLPDMAVDRISISGHTAEFQGWVLPSSPYVQSGFLANGRLCDAEFRKTTRPDLERVFRHTGLATCPLDYQAKVSFDDNSDFLDIRYTENGSEFETVHATFPIKAHCHPLPGGERMGRVYGNSSEASFLLTGATSFRKPESIITRHFSAGRGKQIRILDWGCGCAGVGRYFINSPNFEYHGVDIDFDNIDYCQSTFANKRATFSACSLMPPMDYEDGSFDVIFGISVVTHLSEANHLTWLKELRRLIRPGGIVVLTVLGLQSIAKYMHLLESRAFVNCGFAFFTNSNAIGKIIGVEDYYGTTFHLPHYVFSKWSEYFSVEKYTASGFSHQDVIVLRPA